MKSHSLGSKWTIAIAVLSFAITASAVPIGITNGSFETPGFGGSYQTLDGPGNTTLTGWTINGSIDYIGTYWQAADGNQSLDMNGYFNAGSIEQQIYVPYGGNVSVNFSLSGNPDDAAKIKTLYVSLLTLGGTELFTFDATASTHSDMKWELRTALYKNILQGNYILKFAGMGTVDNIQDDSAWGPALDNVSASVSVPDGGMTVALLGLSMTALGWMRRKIA